MALTCPMTVVDTMDGSKIALTTTHTDATKGKPQGGNSTKDKYWMKWCDPTTYQAKDKPE